MGEKRRVISAWGAPCLAHDIHAGEQRAVVLEGVQVRHEVPLHVACIDWTTPNERRQTNKVSGSITPRLPSIALFSFCP